MAPHFAQIIARGHWGEPATPGLPLNISAKSLAKMLRTSPRNAVNVRIYGKSGKGEENGDDVRQPAIGLTYSIAFGDSKAAWTANTVANAADWEELPNPFGGNAPGLAYTNGAANTAAKWTTNAAIARNRSFSIRAQLNKPGKAQKRHLVAWHWGAAPSRWRFEIADGQMQVMRLAAAWTDAGQAALDQILNTDAQLTVEQQSTVDALRAELYTEAQDVSLGVGRESLYSTPFVLTFIPEPLGRLKIRAEGDGETTVEHSDILKTRKPGIMWDAAPLSLSTNGGSMYWQLGFPGFARTGTVKQVIKWMHQTPLTDLTMVRNGQWDASQPGTSISFTLHQINEIFYELRANFFGNGDYSPFLYSFEGGVLAGPRSGLSDVSWDSNNHLDLAGNPPFKELVPNIESGSLRSSYTATLRNKFGALALPGTHQQALHDRMCDLVVNGQTILKNGIIRTATLANMQSANTNQAPALCFNFDSEAVFQISDMWALMDEDLMDDDPIGDGLRLGAFLRIVLRGAGVRNAEMAGIDVNAGRVLPKAALGEAPCVRPGEEVSRGDYLRSLVEEYGRGWQLCIIDGVWTFAAPSQLVKAAFSGAVDATTHRIIGGIDVARDFSDCFNLFRCEGVDETGEPLVYSWGVKEGWNAPNWKGFIGRIKKFRTRKNHAIRTADEANDVLRSLVRNNAKPGRFFQFTSNYYNNLFPGDFVTVDGILCELVRVNTGSIIWNNDRMTVIAQEVIYVA